MYCIVICTSEQATSYEYNKIHHQSDLILDTQFCYIYCMLSLFSCFQLCTSLAHSTVGKRYKISILVVAVLLKPLHRSATHFFFSSVFEKKNNFPAKIQHNQNKNEIGFYLKIK